MSDVAERERTAGDISEGEKLEFIQLVRQGLNRQEAAHTLDLTPRLFRSLCSPHSPFYDEDFARSYGDAIGSLEYEQHRLERLRAEAQRRALLDSDRLLEKLLMVYDPDWQKLREKETKITVDIVVQRVFNKLPTDKMEQLVAWLEELEQANVIEGEIAEIEAGTDDRS